MIFCFCSTRLAVLFAELATLLRVYIELGHTMKISGTSRPSMSLYHTIPPCICVAASLLRRSWVTENGAVATEECLYLHTWWTISINFSKYSGFDGVDTRTKSYDQYTMVSLWFESDLSCNTDNGWWILNVGS